MHRLDGRGLKSMGPELLVDLASKILGDCAIESADQYACRIDAKASRVQNSEYAPSETESLSCSRSGLDPQDPGIFIYQRQELRPLYSYVPRRNLVVRREPTPGMSDNQWPARNSPS